MSNWKHLRAIVFLPGTVTVLVPAVLLYLSGGPNFGAGLATPWNLLVPILGCVLIAMGLRLMVGTVSRFAREGEGTLAPWDPTEKLVVSGVYQHVRNPMISGVFAVLLGESLLFGSRAVLFWFVLFVLGNMAFIPLWEEPFLEGRFGEDYRRYKQNVPRWIPRLTPWQPPQDA